MSAGRLVAFVVLTLVWGLSFVAAKVALRSSDPVLLASLRLLVGAPLLFAYAAFLGRRLRPAPGDAGFLLASAVFNAALLHSLFLAGLEHLSAGVGAVLFYTYPVITAALAPLVLHEHLDRSRLAGVASGFAGVAIAAGLGTASRAGPLFMLGGALSWSAGTMVFKRFLGDRDVLPVTAWSLLLGGIMAAVVSLVVEGVPVLPPDPWLWVSVAYLGVAATGLAWAMWFSLLRASKAGVASAFVFMTPIFGLLFGWLLLSEPLTAAKLAGAGLVVLGIYAVNRGSPAAVAPAPGAPAR